MLDYVAASACELLGPHPALSQAWARVHLSWDRWAAAGWRKYWDSTTYPCAPCSAFAHSAHIPRNANVGGGKLLSPRIGREVGREGRKAGSLSLVSIQR